MNDIKESDRESLIETLSEIQFDSTIFIFGFGNYLDIIKKYIVETNNVFIFDLDNSSKELAEKNMDNIYILEFEEEKVQNILYSIIEPRNYMNIYVNKYNDYAEKYKKEYDKFIELLDYRYFKMRVFTNTSEAFKKILLENRLSNIQHIKESTPIDKYIHSNKDIPGIIVSAGPSLDKNIQELKEMEERLSNFFIVAGNRTASSLIKNGIKPDLIVSLDPQDITYEMLEDYLDLDIPLLYYDGSNRKLVENYKGPKIFTNDGSINTIKGLEDIAVCYMGGSVAHTSTDIAVALGCNPIIFIGQDFAYTYGREHAKIAENKADDVYVSNKKGITTKDVKGEDIETCLSFNLYRQAMEYYINLYTKEGVEFINCSYGAHIEGAEYEKLSDVIKYEEYNKVKNKLLKIDTVDIDIDEVNKNILNHIEQSIINVDELIEICEKILNNKYSKDESIENFLKVMNFIETFFSMKENAFISSYLDQFLIDVQQSYFKMKASDYPKLAGDIMYQSDIFSKYLKDLKDILNEVKVVYNEIL